MIFLVITYKKYCGGTMAHLIILWYFETLATTSKNIMVLFKNTMAVYYGTFLQMWYQIIIFLNMTVQ